MNGCWDRVSSIGDVETIILDKFRKEPFHNLHLLSGTQLDSFHQGGTCSDKTLSFLSDLREAGIDASLHTGFIGGKEIHRLAEVSIDGRAYFADVGNGWPALRLYPSDRPTSCSCYGMQFRTEIDARRLTVFHTKHGREAAQLEVNFNVKPASEIRDDIAKRFSSGIVYPFSNSLRFSMVVDDRFLFLRGDRLEIYSDNGFTTIAGIEKPRVASLILEYFRYDIRSMLPSEVSIMLESSE